MPEILKPCQDGTWKFVGVVYIRCLIFGEAVEELERGVHTEERLTLI